MKIDRDYKGRFWIPEKDAVFTNGHLRFSKSGYAFLDLFGAFDDLSLGIKGKKRQHTDFVFGNISNQHTCIFYNCKLSQSATYIPYTLVNFDYFIHASTDAHISGPIGFESVTIKFAHLDRWVNYDDFVQVWDKNELIGIQRKREDDLQDEIYEDETYKLKVYHLTSLPFINPPKDYVLGQESKLKLEIKGEVNFDQVFAFIDKLNDLFMFLFCSPISLLNDLEFERENDHETYYCFRNHKRANLNPNLRNEFPRRPLLDLTDMRNYIEPQELFGNWFGLYANLSYPIELLIKSFENPKLNHENQFLNLMYALDCIEPKIDQEEKEEFELSKKESDLLDKLIDEYGVLQNETRQLRSFLIKKKRSKLKDKFKALLSPFKEQLEVVLDGDLSDFIEITVNTRNHLAHENSTEPRLTKDQYSDYNKKLQAVLVFYLGQLCGIPKERLQMSIQKHRNFQ